MTARFPALVDVAGRIVQQTLDRPPSLGAGRLVCVDGPAGSGKTTLAAELRRGFRDSLRRSGPESRVSLVHMDNLFEGWTGLTTGIRTLAEQVLGPLQRGEPGHYRRFDWHTGAYAEQHVVEPCDVLVVEGVGCGGARHGRAAAITYLVWVEAPPAVRLERGLARDGEHLREHWRAFSAEEDAMFARERTRERADVVVDGRTGHVTAWR